MQSKVLHFMPSLYGFFRFISSVWWAKWVPFTLEVKVPPSARRTPPLVAGRRLGSHGPRWPQISISDVGVQSDLPSVRPPAVRPPSGPWAAIIFVWAGSPDTPICILNSELRFAFLLKSEKPYDLVFKYLGF